MYKQLPHLPFSQGLHFPGTECLLCLTQVSESEIRIAQRAEREQEKIKKTMKARMDFLDFID